MLTETGPNRSFESLKELVANQTIKPMQSSEFTSIEHYQSGGRMSKQWEASLGIMSSQYLLFQEFPPRIPNEDAFKREVMASEF